VSAGLFRWAEAGEWVREAGRVLKETGARFPPPRAVDPPPAPPHSAEWLGRLLGAAGERALGELTGRFAALFHAVEAFHAARPDDPGSFARDGVRASSAAALDAEARARFTGVPRAALDEALARQDPSIVEGRCGFSVDGRFPAERETFYLLYGSHFLLGTAVRIRRATGVDLFPRLRGRGVPTLLTCAVPLARVPPDAREAICRECLRLALAGVDGAEPPPLRLDFTLTATLEPEHVLRIEHPEPRSDPLRR
jgi:hypothetical protein